MRFIFKTDFAQDIKLAKHGGHKFWYGALMLALLAAPWLLPEYWLAQLTFVLAYSVVGLGLMLVPRVLAAPDDAAVASAVRAEVAALCRAFPLSADLIAQ